MPTGNNSQQSTFNDNYGVSFDAGAMQESARVENVFNSFTFEGKSEATTYATMYYNTISETLLESIDKKTKINKEGFYDLSDLDIAKFVREFEDVVKQVNDTSKTPRNRKSYEGMKFNNIVKKLKEKTNEYNKPVHEIWASKVLNGDISHYDLKSITDDAIAKTDNVIQTNRGYHDIGDITNIVFAYEAMSKIREQRGFWWKAFHLYRNYKEGQYFDALSQKKEAYVRAGAPVDEVSRKLRQSVLADAYKNTDRTLKRKDMKETNKKIQSMQNKEEEKRVQVPSVSDRLRPTVEGVGFKEKLTESIVNSLPKCMWNKQTQKTILNSVITNTLITEAKNANKIFDQSVHSGTDPQKAIENNVRQVFEKAYMLVSSLGYMDGKDQLLAAQKMTDVVMQKISPATLSPEEYEEFTNGYVLNNPLEFQDITGLDGTEPSFIDAKTEYEKMSRENVAVNLDQQPNEVVPPVVGAPDKNVIIINK